MIEVQYSCRCGVKDRAVMMPERGDGEDIARWVEKVCIPHLAADHVSVSPLCTAREMINLKIPLADGKPVGQIQNH